MIVIEKIELRLRAPLTAEQISKFDLNRIETVFTKNKCEKSVLICRLLVASRNQRKLNVNRNK